jgi:hypothetical protein
MAAFADARTFRKYALVITEYIRVVHSLIDTRHKHDRTFGASDVPTQPLEDLSAASQSFHQPLKRTHG